MVIGVFLACVALAASLSAVSDATALSAAIKVVGGTIAAGVLPGAALILSWRPRVTFGLLEFLAISIALSLGVVHLVTVLLILAHGGIPSASVALLAALAVIATGVLVRRGNPVRVRIEGGDLLGLLVLGVLATVLYVQGSPVVDWEDQVHVSIVRRLAALDRLTLDNFYLTPHVIYTYPFPSTHAFMALVTRIGDIDALFVYHKLRFFWGPAAILMLYLGALSVFASPAIALTSLVTAAVLTLTGVFAVVEGSYWGQLATYSHASDVAMAVLLPALLALSYRFIVSETGRERRLLLLGAMMLAFSLTVVHIRELVQYLAYLGCFVAMALAWRAWRPQAQRAAALIVAAVAVAAMFLVWHAHEVRHVTDLVDAQREKLVSVARATPSRDLLLASAGRVLPSFVQWVDAPFNGVTPFLLFAGPIAVVAFRFRPLAWLIAGSTVVYLLVMNVPLLAIPYIYLTYYEILITPIRNVIPFIHMLAGPILFVLAACIWAAVRPRALAVVLLAATGTVLGAVAYLSPLTSNRTELRFFVPAILAWAASLLYLRGEPKPVRRWQLAIAMTTAAIAAGALWPDHAPALPPVFVNVRWAEDVTDPQRSALEERFSLIERDHTDRPDTRVYQITNVSKENVRALVTNSAIRDTHHIDRGTFEVEQPVRRWYEYPDRTLLIVTATGLWICGFIVPMVLGTQSIRAAEAVAQLSTAPPYVRFAVVALLAVPFFVFSASQRLSPANGELMKPFGHVQTPAQLLPQTECLDRYDRTPSMSDTYKGGPVRLVEVLSCPPDQEVTDWIRANVPVSAVFAVDHWNEFMPTVFLPQQVAAFSGFEFSLPNAEEVYPAYDGVYRVSMRERGVQPFFNDAENPGERAAFLKHVGITHVLVDPQYYWTMLPVLDALPTLLTRRFDDGRWAVYEVRRDAKQDALD